MKLHFLFGTALFGAALGSVLLGACSAQPGDEASPSINEATEADQQATEVSANRPEAVPEVVAHRRTKLANGLVPGMTPIRKSGGTKIQDAVMPTCTNPKVQYFGGPIVMAPIIVPVFWSSHVNPAVTAPTTGIAQFYTDMMQSNYWQWLQEYDTVGLANGTGQAILPGTVATAVTLVPSRCATGTNCTVSDAQIQTELTTQINNKVLPAPTLDCTGNVQTIYMIDFPPNVTISFEGSSSCQVFCAYHNTGTYGAAKTPLIYGVIPDQITSACAGGCGIDPGTMGNTTSNASHELTEALTDPDIGLDTQGPYAAPAGWATNQASCQDGGEIADICIPFGAVDDTITVGGRTWYVQELWSNKQNKCTSTGTPQAVCSGTTVKNCRLCSCGDDGGACSGATSVCETTSTNVLFGGCEQCTSKNDTCTGGATCDQSTTPAQDDICSGCTPKTSCPNPDNCGTIPDGCGGTVTCGAACNAPQTCGGGGTVNVCGCTPLTACPAGDNCGTIADGCGGMITCGSGTCTAPQTCGGGGTPNVCGMGTCVPITTCPAGDTCGTISNGCNGMVNCGTCTAPQTCGGGTPSNPNQCGCTPLATCPAGADCGTLSNGCGGTLVCGGACNVPQTCGGGGIANVCGCTPLATCPAGTNCGTLSNGCGGLLSCGGACAAGETCGGGGTPNVCGASTTSSSSSSTSASSTSSSTSASSTSSSTSASSTSSSTSASSTSSSSSSSSGTTSSTSSSTSASSTSSSTSASSTSSSTSASSTSSSSSSSSGTTTSSSSGGTGGSNATSSSSGGTGGSGCVPQTMCVAGYQCGAVPDGCGGMFMCGTCAQGQVCNNFQCVADTSTSSSSGGTGGSAATTSSSSSGTATGTGTTSSSGFTTSSSSGFTTSSSSGTGASTASGLGQGGDTGAGGGGGSGSGSNQSSGCGCETVGESGTSNASLSVFGMLALAGAFGSRRRRR